MFPKIPSHTFNILFIKELGYDPPDIIEKPIINSDPLMQVLDK